MYRGARLPDKSALARSASAVFFGPKFSNLTGCLSSDPGDTSRLIWEAGSGGSSSDQNEMGSGQSEFAPRARPVSNVDCGRGFAKRHSSNHGLYSRPKALQTLPLSGDQTGLLQSSPRKREFLRFELETFGNFSPRLPFSGSQRLWTIAQKPYKMRYFQRIQAHPLRLSDCLAGDAVLIAPVSRQTPC